MIIHRLIAAVVAVLLVASAEAQPSNSGNQLPPNVVWFVTNFFEVYRWTNNSFERMPGSLEHVSVGTDGAVWGVDPDNNPYRWTGSQWQQVPGKFRQVSVRNAQEVWGVGAAGVLFHWNGSDWVGTWDKLDYVSVGGDGAVWGIVAGDIIRRDPARRLEMSAEWTRLPRVEGVRRISVTDEQHVLAITHSGAVFQWTGTGWQKRNPEGSAIDAVLAADERFWVLHMPGLSFTVQRFEGGLWYGIQREISPLDKIDTPFMQFAVDPAGPPTPPPVTSGASGMTPAQEQAVLQAHNVERQKYAGVAPLQWSPALAALAGDWAQRIVQVGKNPPDHRPDADGRALNPLAPGSYLGENIAWGWPIDEPNVLADYVGNWIAEKQNYRYDRDDGFGYKRPPGCDQGKVCGHFTQVIWKGTQYVGCGLAITNVSQEAWLVCNYHPGGNIPNQKPY